MLREILKDEISKIVREMLSGDKLPEISAQGEPASGWKITEPERPENGDYTTNVAFLLAKILGKSPADIGAELKEKLERVSKIIDRVEIKNGFLNIFLKDGVLLKSLKDKIRFPKKKEKVNVEFVSANPTGPLTMANGRGGFYGDVLSSLLERAGYKVTREYYINDVGGQIKLLGESILAAEGKIPKKEEYYKGAYIKKLKGKAEGEAVSALLGEIKSSLKNAGIKFDVWFSEDKNLHKKGEIKKVLELLNKRGVVKESVGALWLDDNVLVKSNQEPTYFLADLAYHYDKFIKRKFDVAINIWGADHHGNVARMKRGVVMLGVNPERLKIIIMQLVRLVRGGKEVRIGKRTGEFVTMDELLDEVGLDAARWFFLEKSPHTHIDFDLDLAKERSEKNPVYYVQYAHTRMASIIRKSKIKSHKSKFKEFSHQAERELVKKILRYPEILEDISKDYQVQHLTTYAYELAQTFSAFYRDVKVIGSERETELLDLVSKAKETLGDVLKLLGISAPERM